jgi:hydrogenase-4 component F
VALFGAFLHLLFNSFGKAALFFMAGNIHRGYGSREVGRISGLMRRLPWSALVWALAFLYIVGTPPFGIFFSEVLVMQGMIHGGNWLSLSIFLALLMVIFIGMSGVVLRMLQTPGEGTPAPAFANPERLNLSHALGLYAMAVSVPIALFQPAFLFNSLHTILPAFGLKP